MLVGHQKQKKYFNNLIKNESLGHAYIFTGPEMIGKKTFALELSKNILGNIDNNPDFKFLAPKTEEGESKIYIEDIRDLKKIMSFRSYGGGQRVIVIDNVHCLTSEASNAFLKLLEEPPAGSVIFLISSAPGLIPVTILSRCEEIKFLTIDDKDLTDYISENKKLNKDDGEFIIKLAGGRVGFVNYIIESKKLDETRKAVDDLRKMLGSGIYEKMEYAKKVHDKENYGPTVDYWLRWVSAHVSSSPKNEKIVKDLLILNSIVSKPQFNHRLALENFLLNL